MLRRTKDDCSRHKSLNQQLQSELDAIRGTNSSEAGDRTRNANNGRITPSTSASSDEAEAYRLKLADAQRQVATLTKATAELSTLKTEHAALVAEQARIKDAATAEIKDANDKIQALSIEVERLHQLSAGVGDVKRLQMDYADLKTENEDLNRKIRLLLDAQDYGGERRRAGDQEESLYGSEGSGDEYDEAGLNQSV